MTHCRAEKDGNGDKPPSPNELAEKGEQMKEDAREHVENMVSLGPQGAVCFASQAQVQRTAFHIAIAYQHISHQRPACHNSWLKSLTNLVTVE